MIRNSNSFLPRTPRGCWLVLAAGVVLLAPGAGIVGADARITSARRPIATVADAGESPVGGAPSVSEAGPAKRKPDRHVIDSNPARGATGVDPELDEIRVTFDRDMQRGMSWTGRPPLFPPIDKSRKLRWINSRTCVLPVKLEAGKYYRVGINSDSNRNFRLRSGAPVPPSVLSFTTKGASDEVVRRLHVPAIVSLEPPNGANNVDPASHALRVTFDVPMGEGFSWAGGGPKFPKSPDGAKATWSSDAKTCTLPVVLEPGLDYQLGLNSQSYIGFQSEWGVPLEPVVYQFHTRAVEPKK